MSVEVYGPQQEGSKLTFAVIRYLKKKKDGKPLVLVFKITLDERTNKWHHTNLLRKEQDGLCYERLYIPRRDCACIRECKKRLLWKKKN